VLHLTEARALELLHLAGDVHIPPPVKEELAYYLPGRALPPWITVDVLTASSAAEATAWQQAGLLHSGEAEAVALAQQLRADWLLTDDTAARLFATELGLEVHGSLGVVLWAAAVGHLDHAAADRALTELAASSLWISARVLAEARSALDEMFR
jgi:hypothetical protein